MSAAGQPILGRFQLLGPLAQGGMASVWRAVHREQGVPTAIKVLGDRCRNSLVDALRAEIRATARLEHPHIVSVFDQGVVDPRTSEQTGGALAAGSPWVALELVDGPTLTDYYPELDWPKLQAVLEQLLDALAHAHAHGVIHRDLKLSNVLVGKQGAKLMDFGIAYALRPHEDGGGGGILHAGTPRYMAPEQLLERIDDQGPWTDLYALGVMAWRLASRTSPFPDGATGAREAKLRGRLEPFQGRFPLPPGFLGWCARLLQPAPTDRFQAAADALHALRDLSRRPPEEPSSEPHPFLLPSHRPAPAPRSWRPTRPWRRPVELVGCGLRLYGLRDAPFVGRNATRDRLWEALLTVHRTRTPRVVLLRGPSGYGKSSLAQWLGRRAEELGAGVALRTRWADERLPGLPGLVARRLRCLGDPAELLPQRIEAYLRRCGDAQPGEPERLLQLLQPTAGVEELGAEDRFHVVTRCVQRAAQHRPAVLHFDDAHANAEAFTFPSFLLEREDTPVLFVLTVQEEALATRAASVIALEELAAHPHVQTLRVGPLALEEQVDFVQGLLRLEPALAERVARRTEGNPLFASQLLDDWVSRDLLELSVDGFRLRDALKASLPDSLAQVWHERVERLLDSTSASFRVPLELAAVLGSYVDTREWQAVCDAAGWPLPTGLANALIARHLATPEGDGWHFVHGMLREAILKSAAASGRLQQHHRNAARTIDGLGGAAVRVGRHLLQANAGAAAIDPLEAGAEEATRSGDYQEGLRLLRARAALMRQLRVRASDPRWGRGWVAYAELLARLDRWEEAAEYAEQARNEAAEHGWGRVEVEALMLLVENRAVTDLERARELLERAYQVAAQPGNEDTVASVCLLAAQVHRRSGDLLGSLLFGKRALTHVLKGGGIRRARCEIELTQTLIKLGELDDARRHAARAEQLAERQGHPFDLAVCAYLRACIGRAQGDLPAAEQGYRDATDRFVALGDANAWSMRAHLGIVLAERGQIDEARQLFDKVLRSRSQLGDLLAHLGSLLCVAGDDEPLAFANHVRAVERFVQRGWCDPLAARIVERAAQRASAAGFPRRARVLLGLAHRQRERLAITATG